VELSDRKPSGAVWVSPYRPSSTGVGVVQQALYRRLPQRGFEVLARPEPANRLFRGVWLGLDRVKPPYAAALITATPAPLVLRVPSVAFVYDLRWRRTRSLWARNYRYRDLRHIVACAHHLLAISAHTRDALVDLFPEAAAKSSVLHLGPGIIELDDRCEGDTGTVILLGRSGYKRNELIADAFALARPQWAHRFICVGLSDAAYGALVVAFGKDVCEAYQFVDDNIMRSLFRRAAVYVSGSLEEGFGLPAVEALAAGCQVIAVRQPLTEEILDGAAVLIADGSPADVAAQLHDPTWVTLEAREARISMYSWETVADVVAERLAEIVP
jgi:glycosyltransferase involved in cell wall biosynthesis